MPNFRGRRFTNAHETMIWASRSAAAKSYTFNYDALKAGNEDLQVRSDWFIPLCTGAERLKDADGRKVHPTQKPEALLARVLLASSMSATWCWIVLLRQRNTGAVARRSAAAFIGIERDAAYAAAARARIAAVSPLEAAAIAPAPEKRSEPRIPFLSVLEAGFSPRGDPDG